MQPFLHEIPLPPAELRRLVTHEDSLFELPPAGSAVFPNVPRPLYRSVFDFGCGCGRLARQFLAQDPRPQRYVGIDIHRGMIEWCQQNLTPLDPAFQFYHHDVWNLGLGPDNTRQATAPFPVGDREFTFVVAHSVFTHLYKHQTEHYLGEIARILTDDGIARTTWFLFDRETFPMMFDFQVCLFINEVDPTNAVIYDWRWLLRTLEQNGLRIKETLPPSIRGHQWELYLVKAGPVGKDHAFPLDAASMAMMCGSGVGETGERRAKGSGSTAPEPAPATEPSAAPQTPESEKKEEVMSSTFTVEMFTPPPAMVSRHYLRYTSRLGRQEFEAKCRQNPWWYHSYYFDNGFFVRGDYDIGADIAGYGFPESMEGMHVLDIGTGAGWFALYFEQLGAEVVTVDARGYCDFDVYGRYNYPSIESEGRQPDFWGEDGEPIYYSPVSRGFWIMREILGSKVQFRHARAYDVRPELFGGMTFDLVFMGAILCHLRDPIGALMAARSVCRGRIIASTPVVLGETGPDVLPRQYLPYTDQDKISWWLPNEACFKHWFLAAGFTNVDVSVQIQLRADLLRYEDGKPANGTQTLRIGTAFVP